MSVTIELCYCYNAKIAQDVHCNGCNDNNGIATSDARCSMILLHKYVLLHLIHYFNMAISGARRSMILLHLVLDVI